MRDTILIKPKRRGETLALSSMSSDSAFARPIQARVYAQNRGWRLPFLQALAAAVMITHGKSEAIERCATPGPQQQQIEASAAARSDTLAALEFPSSGVIIPVTFHVLTGIGIDGKPAGNVSERQATAQVEVLNKAYLGSGFQFRLKKITHTSNRSWYSDCLYLEDTIKKSLADDPRHVLNIYTCASSEYLGWTYFPSDFAENSYRHGVFVHFATLPGGDFKPYHLGDTAVHEVGHYLGLFHTFEGSCAFPGDTVSDTAYEREPNFGCPTTRDTCAGLNTKNIGKDPVFNYMDYTDDACMREFSIGQIRLMRSSVLRWRPSLVSGRGKS